MRRHVYPAYQQLYFGAFLAAIAGGLDAYTYLQHGGVFAGLQTGNLILLGVSLSKGQFVKVGYYLIAIIAFGLGTIFIRHMQHFFKQNYLKRAYFVLGYEFVLMVLVAMISQRAPDVITVMLLAITAAAQLQEFRKLQDGPFTSLMMTGNIRTTAENLYTGYVHHDVTAQQKATDTGIVIGSFAAGAFLSGIFVPWLKDAAILVPAVLVLGAVFYLAQHSKSTPNRKDPQSDSNEKAWSETTRASVHPHTSEDDTKTDSEPETRSSRRRRKL
ncbi:Membrane protein, putative [Pediococcus damnosus]|uniref:Membrane protein, putative n=1 Tax=Pediococcus damnosus TaxID=51663 RepID=A0A0R2HWN9_9LACO|nr:YoaK family protein [Pediococcus damnosus]AMV60335.1 Membrane protein, putative [Pediococcus damnosus]AMV62870.1 Membrane protein, putative [Pediococcus damnosus]AMV64585.1 Membrane protein, putative [Pediococcus damnosus]AMV67246.1 Membrane protein, putative [Pediococcus damnosus]KRN54077.1 membrane protein [Pediococcus damnosus]